MVEVAGGVSQCGQDAHESVEVEAGDGVAEVDGVLGADEARGHGQYPAFASGEDAALGGGDVGVELDVAEVVVTDPGSVEEPAAAGVEDQLDRRFGRQRPPRPGPQTVGSVVGAVVVHVSSSPLVVVPQTAVLSSSLAFRVG